MVGTTVTPPHVNHQFPHWNMLIYLTDVEDLLFTDESFKSRFIPSQRGRHCCLSGVWYDTIHKGVELYLFYFFLIINGEVVEWFMALVLKTNVESIVGSNPPLLEVWLSLVGTRRGVAEGSNPFTDCLNMTTWNFILWNTGKNWKH